MNFLCIDQHIAVVADIRSIFNQLGHTVREISLSGHASVIGRPRGNIPILQGDGWCSVIHGRKFEEFFKLYEKEFEKYDGFICCYPPIFSMLYKYWKNKPIIIDIPIRYECGADNDAQLWLEFNDYLRDGVDAKRILLVANSVYDKKYTEGFLNREVRYISSWCGDYTGMTYNPVNEQFLYYASFRIDDKSGRMIKKHDALRAGHAWQSVADYKGCIHFPYNISTMSTFEQYAANIPVFFPTKRFLLELYQKGYPVIDQISWNQGSRINKKSLIEHSHEYDPNAFEDIESMSHWLDYADYYRSAMSSQIQYFDNPEELREILSLSVGELLDISERIQEDNKERKEVIFEQWEHLINEML